MVIICKSKFELTKINEIYQVYGICLNKGGLEYLIIDVPNYAPSWYPAKYFDITSNLFPIEWYFNFFGYDDVVHAIWGYKELALNRKHHDDLFEHEPWAIEIFNKRKKEIEEYEELAKVKKLFLK